MASIVIPLYKSIYAVLDESKSSPWISPFLPGIMLAPAMMPIGASSILYCPYDTRNSQAPMITVPLKLLIILLDTR